MSTRRRFPKPWTSASVGLALLLGACTSLLGIEERRLDTHELGAAGYEGCKPENGVCSGCTSEWHRCVCQGWNQTPEAELRLECAALAPAAIRADVERAAQEEYDEYLASLDAGGGDDDSRDDDRPERDDDLSTDDDTGDDDRADDDTSDDDLSTDDDRADDDTSDDAHADDDAPSDSGVPDEGANDDASDDDSPPLSTFNEDYCAFGMPKGPCEGCFCGECRDEIQACLADRGCSELMDCVLGHHCDPSIPSGAGSCNTQSTCRALFTEYGGPGSEPFALFDAALRCRGESFCPCNGDPLGCVPEERCEGCLGCWDECACNMNSLEECHAQCGDPSCNPAQGCDSCSDCVDQCLCEGANQIGFCVQQCGEAAVACSPSNDCQCADCQSSCECSGQTPQLCEEECKPPGEQTCSPVDDCRNCSTCEGACSCASGGFFGECLTGCDSPYGCSAPECSTCGSCTAQCECETGDPFACIASCNGFGCTDPALSPCEACSCTACPSAFSLCAELSGCPELMRCLEGTQCANVADCSRPETCQAQVEAVAPAALGIVESLAECRREAECACSAGPAMTQWGAPPL